jgi:cytochrome b6-f complex iron-sulfur subunit
MPAPDHAYDFRSDPAPPGCPGRNGAAMCSRRAILAAGAGLLGSALVAACSASRGSTASTQDGGAGGSTQDGGAGGSTQDGGAGGSTELLDPAQSSASASGAGGSASGPVTSTAVATAAAPTRSSSTPTSSSTATRSAAPPTHSATRQPTHSATPTTAPPSPSGTVLAPLSSVPVGGSLVVDSPGGPVAIGRPSSNRVVAHTAICTHQGCTVAAAGAQLACPCHGSIYDAFSGAVIQDPAPRALSAITVVISGADIVAP